MFKIHKNPLINCIILPLKISPLFSVIQIVNRLMNSAIPVFTILTTAAFINTTIAIFNGEAMLQQILLPLFCIVGIELYNKVAWMIIEFVIARHKIDIADKVKIGMIKKRGSLAYQYVEDNETWDLIGRVCRNPVESVYDSFSCVIGLCQKIIELVSLVILLSTYIWWGGIVITALSIPTLVISFISGKACYHMDSSRKERRCVYTCCLWFGEEQRQGSNASNRIFIRLSFSVLYMIYYHILRYTLFENFCYCIRFLLK